MAIIKYLLESGTDSATSAVKSLAENGGKYINGKNGFNGNGNGNGLKKGIDPVNAGAYKAKSESSRAAANKALNKAKSYTPTEPEQVLEIPVTARIIGTEQSLLKLTRKNDANRNQHRYPKNVIGRRTLPITDRVVEVAEVAESMKAPYRNRLRTYMAEHDDNLRGHMKEVGTLKLAGQEFRGKKTSIVEATGRPDAKLKNRGQDVIEGKRRWARMVSQTVDEADLQVYFKEGGHHKLELDLGAAITEGMPENQVKPFWSLVQRSYPYLFPGNHPKNLQRFELGFTDKLHKEVHRRLNRAGLRAKDVEKALRGRPTSEKFAFLEKVSGILEEIDEFMGKEMSKNMRKQARALRNT